MKDNFIIVSGGNVQWGPDNCEVIDFDNLLPDTWENGDTSREWGYLTLEAQDYIQLEYPDEYTQIMNRIEDES